MRLLVISGFWPTRCNPITGIFVVQQVQAYIEAGCDVTVIIPQTIRGWERGRQYHQHVGGVDVFCPVFLDVPQAVHGGHLAVRLNTSSCGRAILTTLKRNEIGHRFDGIHIHDIRYGGLSYVKWGVDARGPAVLTLHGVDPFIDARASRAWFAGALDSLWGDLAYVTLVGKPLLSYAERLGVPADKCSIVHNGSKLPEEWHVRQRPLSQRRVVLSVSNLEKLKGLDLNLKALGQIRREYPALEWEYRIVGDGPERESLKRCAQDAGVADRVTFCGRLTHDDTLAEIVSCDVFSLPSWGENFGIVYLEAMGRGRPVIGCRDWGAEEMVRDGTDGLLVEPRDQGSLLLALRGLLRDPHRCMSMGLAARERAVEFSWARNVRQHLDLFAAATNSRGKGSPCSKQMKGGT